MNILIEKYSSDNLENVTEIWNNIIDEGTSFHWDYHFSTDAIQKSL
jgi:hypothetical protein